MNNIIKQPPTTTTKGYMYHEKKIPELNTGYKHIEINKLIH